MRQWHSHLLHRNNSLIPDRKQQYQQNELLGFLDCSVSYKSDHTERQSISTTDMTVVMPLNKVIHCARSSQLLSDITCGSTVYTPWPSTLYCMTRGVFSSTIQIGMEYIRFTFLWTLFVVHPYKTRVFWLNSSTTTYEWIECQQMQFQDHK